MGFLYLVAFLPLVLCQNGPVEPTRPEPTDLDPMEPTDFDPMEPTDASPSGDCTEDASTAKEYCNQMAENNWCDDTKDCCLTCQEFEAKKDPECHDTQRGCLYYKKDMCEWYPEMCRKACGLC